MKTSQLTLSEIKSAYNEFRNNEAPYKHNQAENGVISYAEFQLWFDAEEDRYFDLMAEAEQN